MSDFAHTILSLERGTIDCNGFQMISIANNCNNFLLPIFPMIHTILYYDRWVLWYLHVLTSCILKSLESLKWLKWLTAALFPYDFYCMWFPYNFYMFLYISILFRYQSDPICTCAAVLCGVEVPGRVPERWRFAEATPQEISRPRIPIVSSTCPILSYLYTEKKRSTLCKLYIVILMTIFQK